MMKLRPFLFSVLFILAYIPQARAGSYILETGGKFRLDIERIRPILTKISNFRLYPLSAFNKEMLDLYDNERPGLPMAIEGDFDGDSKKDLLLLGFGSGKKKQSKLILVSDSFGAKTIHEVQGVVGLDLYLQKPIHRFLSYHPASSSNFFGDLAPRMIFQLDTWGMVSNTQAYIIDGSQAKPPSEKTFKFKLTY